MENTNKRQKVSVDFNYSIEIIIISFQYYNPDYVNSAVINSLQLKKANTVDNTL